MQMIKAIIDLPETFPFLIKKDETQLASFIKENFGIRITEMKSFLR